MSVLRFSLSILQNISNWCAFLKMNFVTFFLWAKPLFTYPISSYIIFGGNVFLIRLFCSRINNLGGELIMTEKTYK